MDRTKFRLVVGGNDPAVVALFRDIEKKVIGAEAAAVRETAAVRQSEERTGQLALLHAPRATDAHYDSLHDQALRDAPQALLANLTSANSLEFGSVWPTLLESLHMTRGELARVAWKLHKDGEIFATNVKPRERTMSDQHLLRRK
ncbi:MAG: hypothetical protein ABSF69_17070 [Polyangiaceae bacterium]|jgi:hypothetical protein